jgi:hypothetical protein
MTFQEHIQVLRLHLLGMSRLSQRALDYSIKGYELSNPDFCNHVGGADCEIKKLYRQTKYLCLKLAIKGVKSPSEFRFVLAALRVNRALYKTYSAATHIAKTTLLSLAGNSTATCPMLNQFGELTNCLMRLCVVSLFEKELSHAEWVVQSQGVWRRCEAIFNHLPHGADQRIGAAEIHALTITKTLGTVAKQAHEIAEAILYWLKGSDSALALEADGHNALDYFLSSGRFDVEGRFQLVLEEQFLKSGPITPRKPGISTRPTSLPSPLASCQSGSD